MNISENNFEQCLKCTVCTVYCPVAAVKPKYPGPKQAGPDGERLRLKKPAFFDESLKYCLNCKRCEVACPHDVRIGDIIQSARIKYSTKKPGLREMMLANTDFMGTVATTMAPVVNASLGLKPVKAILDSVMKIDAHRTFPKYASQKFETWYHRHAEADQAKYAHHVSFFHGCYINYNYPQLGKDFVRVMNALGYGVHLLDREKCCGVALISNGLIDQARHQAEINLDSVRKSVAKGMSVIGASSTCVFTMRDEYPHLLGIDNADVRNSINLATRFIFSLIDSGKAKIAFRPDYKLHLAYHTACHMEKMGWAIYSIEAIRMIPGVKLTVLPSQCCGIAGTYGFKKENYPTSQAIGSTLFRKIEEIKPDYVVTDCETCKWQIEMSTSVSVKHPISILADALDFDRTTALNLKT
ncbi:MAG: anaerobic glycerol-3-phosphate dehydrogenase subunit GlpC [Bacteroidales bacterium]|nr:anaerobic glycerol-3-phosphate dehydrogenase subunit GlpC [Bacteroidales bacterium]